MRPGDGAWVSKRFRLEAPFLSTVLLGDTVHKGFCDVESNGQLRRATSACVVLRRTSSYHVVLRRVAPQYAVVLRSTWS